MIFPLHQGFWSWVDAFKLASNISNVFWSWKGIFSLGFRGGGGLEKISGTFGIFSQIGPKLHPPPVSRLQKTGSSFDGFLIFESDLCNFFLDTPTLDIGPTNFSGYPIIRSSILHQPSQNLVLKNYMAQFWVNRPIPIHAGSILYFDTCLCECVCVLYFSENKFLVWVCVFVCMCLCVCMSLEC